MSSKIYLDYNATTPVVQPVIEAITQSLQEPSGNSSSIHWAGRIAKKQINLARRQISELLSISPRNFVFTSCATESNNLVLQSLAKYFLPLGKKHLVISAIEHPSVLKTSEKLEQMGIKRTVLPVDSSGLVSLDALKMALREDTFLVSIMAANNETGTIQPFREIGDICREKGVYYHTDFVQMVGKEPIELDKWPVDFASFSAHKFYGPRGIGGLYFKEKKALSPLFFGGGQEQALRPGTENISGIVGMGAAAHWISEQLENGSIEQKKQIAKEFEQEMLQLEGVHLNGTSEQKTWNTWNFRFDGLEGDALFIQLDLAGIAVSKGSACSAGTVSVSNTLLQMGLSGSEISSSLRFSMGYLTTQEELKQVVITLKRLLPFVRSLA